MTEEPQSARVLERFARNAVELRRGAGLSQLEIGLRAGLHRTEISMLERRVRVPRLDTVLRIAGAVDAEPRELLEGLSWELDRRRLWEARPEPGRYEVTVTRRRVTREAGGWRPADR